MLLHAILLSCIACQDPGSQRTAGAIPLATGSVRAGAGTEDRNSGSTTGSATARERMDFARVPDRTVEGGEPWHWRVVPYLFAANLDGSLEVGSTVVSTDVSFSDLLQKLDLGGMLLLEGRRGSWGFAVDSLFVDLGEDGKGPAGVSREADVKLWSRGAAGLYSPDPASPYEFVLGLRYLDLEQDLRVGGASAKGNSEVLDGIVGARAVWPFAERWRFGLYGDIGAGDSDLTWQAIADFGYDFGDWGLNLGYRILDYDLEDGSKEFDATLEGWQLGVEYRF